MKRNPWALTEADAAARDEAVLDQFMAAKQQAERVCLDDAAVQLMLERQFGHPAVKQAVLRAVNRRRAAQ